MTDIPKIFDDNGRLIEIDASKLDAPMRERYAAIVTAHAANQQAEQKVADANAEVRDAAAAVANTESYFNAQFPPQTPFMLWQENFGGGPRETMRQRGLIK
jgi:hypothetical protein